jgi:hypothetical protein
MKATHLLSLACISFLFCGCAHWPEYSGEWIINVRPVEVTDDSGNTTSVLGGQAREKKMGIKVPFLNSTDGITLLVDKKGRLYPANIGDAGEFVVKGTLRFSHPLNPSTGVRIATPKDPKPPGHYAIVARRTSLKPVRAKGL